MPHARKSEAGISIIPFTEKGITMKTISLKKWEAVEKQRHRYEIVVVHLLSRVWLFASHGLQHTRLPCPSLSPRVCSNLSPLRWHHFADKGPYSQSYGFPSGHVVISSDRKLRAEELMVLNCGAGEGSWESLGLQGDPTSPFWRSALGFLWKEWC